MRYGCEADIAEEEGYDPDEMEDSDWDKLWESTIISLLKSSKVTTKSMEEKSMEKTTRKLKDLKYLELLLIPM